MKKFNGRIVFLGAGLSLAAALAAAATVWAWQELRQQRTRLLQQEEELAHVPESQVRQTATQAEIAKRQFDIDRISAFVVPEQQLGNVVETLEKAGQDRAVRLELPTVEKKDSLDEAGNIVPTAGPIREVRLKLVGTGNPKNLLALVHDIEHMQLLTYFESWRIDASEQAARNQAAALGAEASPADLALLTADLIVAVRSAEGGQP